MDDQRLLNLRDRYEEGQFTAGLSFQLTQRLGFLRYLRQTGRFKEESVFYLAFGLTPGGEPCPTCEQYSSEKPTRRFANCRVLWSTAPTGVLL